jgi:molybdopterin molybdotransferase
MISVEEAKNIIKANINNLPPIQMALEKAVGYVLVENLCSPINFPSFVQSSMDGYAFAYDDYKKGNGLKLIGEVQAGSSKLIKLEPSQAVRIFTGAPLPEGTDTVLMQEKAKLEGDILLVLDESLQKGSNARPIGADIQANALALEKGNKLTPGAIGFLASLGVTSVSVYKKPSINIILTGNELQTIGTPLSQGKIYESNSYTLKAALAVAGFDMVQVVKIGDTLAETTEALANSLNKFDLTLFTGGISVGDYDFVLEACNANKVEQLFHKIKQKPGKPFYIGKKDEKVVCGLPGNPASVLSCFYNYVSIVLDQMSNTNTEMKTIQANLIGPYKKPAGLTHFLKGLYNASNNEVLILEGQESFKMSSFAIANCFVELPESVTEVNTNDSLKVHLFAV